MNLKKFLSNPRNLLIIYTVTGVIIAAFLFLGLILIINKPAPPINTSAKKAEEKVISNILKNNSQSLFVKPNIPSAPDLNQNSGSTGSGQTPVTQGSQDNPQGTAGTAGLPDPKAVPDINEYNYRYTKITYVEGPAAQICNIYFYGCGSAQSQGSSESYEYFERYHSYYKFIAKDNSNNLSTYTITKYGNDINTHYDYMGGKFAALEESKPFDNFDNQSDYVSYPVSTGTSAQDAKNYLASYFGPNAKLIDTVTENYKQYYIIENQYQTYCGNTDPYLYIPGVEPAKLETVIERMKVDASNFQIVKIDSYLDQVSPEKLISTRITYIQTKKVNYDDVSSLFSSDYDVPIRIVDFTNSQPYSPTDQANRYLVYLSNAHVKVLVPDSYLSSIYSSKVSYGEQVVNSDYSRDRDFYPDTAEGEEMYQMALGEPINRPDLSMYFANGISVNLASTGITTDQLVAEVNKYKSTYSNTESITVNIDGADYPAQKITRRFDYYYPNSNVSYPVSYVSYPTSYPSYSYTNINVIFEYNGRAYNVTMSSDSNAELSFKSYDTDTNGDISYLYGIILNYLQNIYYGGAPISYPSSYPGSYPNQGNFV